MNCKSILKNIFILFLFFNVSQTKSQNLLVNGDFESGSVVGFFSNGAGYTRLTPPFSGATNAGNWALTTNPQLINTTSFVSTGDHTSGTGFMMVIDGNTTGGQQNFWEAGNAGGGVCGLTIGSTYTFSYWIRSVYGPVSGNPTPAIIGVDILNANSVTLVSGSLTAPPTANGWQQVVFTFRPNGSCVNIKLFNNNTNFDGNDFAIDDMSVTAIANNGQLGFCSGSKGEPVFKENFGSGTNYGPQLPAGTTNYTYVGAGFPQDGQYTLHYTTNLIPNSQNWHTSLDHTPDTEIDGTNGKSLIVNASFTAGEFFKRTVTGLCVNTRFEFSAWVMNIYNSASGGCPGTGIPINISFEIWNDTDTVLLQSGNTGNIAGTPTPNWIQYGLVFTTTNQTSVILKMKNNGVGGCGNDLAIDDIMFRSCGDLTTISSPSATGTTYSICQENSPVNITLQANTSGTSTYFYQWQQSSDNITWSDIPGANTTTYITPGITTQRYYRTKVAQDIANLNNNFCSTISDIFTVSFLPSPNPPTSNGNISICASQAIPVLSVTANANLGVNWYDAATGGNLLLSNSLTYLPTIAGTYYAETFTLSDNCRSATRTPVTLTINQPLSATISCGVATANSVTFNWGAVTGATNYSILYSINNAANVNAGQIALTTFTLSTLNPGDSVRISVIPGGVGGPACFVTSNQTCTTVSPCPQPTVTVTQQPTCTTPTGTIVFTSPLNSGLPLPTPSELFISEVTDESSGALSYIEIYNGTGAPKNLANYKLKVYNNGNPTPSNFCDFALSGTLNNNDVYVVAVGNVTNMGGVVPDLVVSACPGYNTNDNVRLATSADVEFDLWGRTDGVDFTPANQTGYTFRRISTAPHPTMTWNPADWTALDPQDYTNIGTYSYQSTNYQYSINGTTYQVSPTFTGLAPGNYNVTIKDLVSGCISTPITLVVNPIPVATAPTVVSPVTYCQNAIASPLTATPSVGGTLNWYGTNAVGGTASATAPTPSTTALGSTTYYVSQTVGGCESPRAAIVVTVAVSGGTLNLICGAATIPFVQTEFDWNNIAGSGISMMAYTYTMFGFPPVSGVLNTGAVGTHLVIPNPNNLPITMTITPANGTMCVAPATQTCGCTSPQINAMTNQVFCGNSSISQLNFTTADAYDTVSWTNSNTAIGLAASGTGSGLFLPAFTSANVATTEVATIGVTLIKNGCVGPTINFTITINPQPVLVVTNPATVCGPASINLTLPAVTVGSTGGGTLSYWTNATGTIALANPNAVTASGTYYIKSAVGTCSDIEPVVVTINPSPALTITNPLAVCLPATVNLTLPAVTAGSTGGGILSYWTNAAGTIALANPNAVTTSGTYYIKSTLGSCSDIEPVIVTVNPSPVLSITNPAAVCSPATINLTLSAVTAGSTGGGTLSYWTNAAGTIALANPNAVTTSGTYYIQSTLGSCSDIEPVIVTINPAPVLSITNPAVVCSPATINLTLPAVTAGSTGGGILSYWANAAGTIALANPNAVTTSGTYYIKSTLGSCSDIEPVIVTVNPSPVLSITNPAAVCSPATINLTLPAVSAGSTGGGTLSYWTNAAGTIALANPNAVTTSGTYYIKSTLGSCSDIEPVTVIINPIVTPTFNITPSVVCFGATITPLPTTSINLISGTWSPALNNTATTTYTFNPIPSVAVPCPTSTTFQIVVIPQIDPVVSIVESCNANSVTVTNPTGINYEYSLDGDAYQTNPTFFNLASGNHTIIARETSANCFSNPTNFIINSVVNDIVVNPNPNPLRLCDSNNDGFVDFDLTQAINSITGGAPYVVTFHETITDANVDGTAIPNPAVYPIINPWTQTIYVRVESSTTSCFEVVQLQLLVDPTPEATTPDDYLQCDYTGAVGYESFDLTTTIPQILGTIDPSQTTVTFHTSQPDADNNTNAISNLTNYINGTIWVQTLYVRVETIVTGCYDTVTLNLIVNPIPNSLQPNYPQYSLCDYTGAIGFETFDLGDKIDDILLGQTGMSVTFYPSLSDAQNNTNAITNLQYMNEIIYVQTLGVVITNTNTGCYVISTMDIRVEPLPEPIPPTEPYTICDDNQDGYSCEFNLTTLETDILQGAAYILSFYETQTDAEIGDPVSAIDTTVPYCSILPFTQILYVRAQDPLTGCWSVIPVVLNVNPSPIAPVNLNNIIVCDQDSNPQNAITRIDLTQRTADVLAQQPASGSYTVTYYNSQPEAESGTAPIINDTNYVGTHGEVIWVRVEDTTTNCYNIGSFELEINTPLLLTTPTPLSMCDNDANPNDQHYSFDLTIRDVMITQGLSGYTVAYYPSLTDAQNNTNVITNPTAYINVPPAVQTLGVVVTSTAGCTSITTLDIRVLPVPTPNTNPAPLAPKCDDNNPGDMLEVFDLTVNAAYIANGDPNVTLHYYHSQADALVPQNEIPNPTAALVGDVDPAEQSVWIRVENSRIDYQGNHCAILVEQPLTVNPLPAVVQPLAPYRVCDNDTDGIAFFDLTNPQLAIAILGANQLPADYTISYYATAVGANPITNTGETPLPASYQNVTPDAQDIYIRVVNNATGCVNATGILPLAVEEYALATGPQTFASCDDYNDPYDGIYQLDLTQYETAILNGQDPLIFLISYYHSQADAEAGINAIALADAQAYVTTPDTDQIWVKVENSSNTITPVCYALTTIDITVERYPNPIITTQNGVNTICVDFTNNAVVRTLTLNSGITNPAAYTFEWFEDASTTPILGATGPTYTVDTASATGATRNYTVRATSISPLLCATTSAAFAVIQSGQAVIPAGTEGYTVTNAFTTSQIITVIVEGYGTYEYSLDDGPRQTSNIFENVPLGPHDIHVWDTEGGVYSCEELVIHNVQIIDYPHYFTPNGDGIHDTWNIKGLEGQPAAKIYIFDRYGKLLKQISSTGTGWDGTYNGQLLPSTDYWFSVDYVEQAVNKQFKAHFSLKR